MAKNNSKRIFIILGVVAVALLTGAFIAKKAGWIGKEPAVAPLGSLLESIVGISQFDYLDRK